MWWGSLEAEFSIPGALAATLQCRPGMPLLRLNQEEAGRAQGQAPWMSRMGHARYCLAGLGALRPGTVEL